jgi:DNA repair protein RadC
VTAKAASYPISQWPEAERPRERLTRYGAAALNDSELLALLVRTGSRGHSALDLAKQAMAQAETCGGWDKMTVQQLGGVPGLGPAKAALILAGLELGRRQSLQVRRKVWRFSGSRASFDYCREHLAGQPQEAFLVIGVDARNRLVGSRVISIGTLTQSLVHPREVFQPILAMRAAGLILAHNHPSGDPTPSPEDGAVTRRLKDCADLLALPLLDHLVVGKDRYFSYADAGWPGISNK